MGVMCNIIQWNCEGLKSKFTSGDIHQLIKETSTSVLCLQETKLKPDAKFSIKKFKGYFKNLQINEGEHAHGGVAVFVKSFISYQIDLQTNLQAVAVSVCLHKRITLCSLYLPPAQQVEKREILEIIKQLPKPFMILGDFNAHHPLWFDTRNTTPRGRMIAEVIEETDLILLDKNQYTNMWKVDKSFSHVDLSLCSPDLASKFHWDVHDEPLSSDHFPVLLKADIPTNKGGCSRWLPQKADWTLYQAETEVKKDKRNQFKKLLVLLRKLY